MPRERIRALTQAIANHLSRGRCIVAEQSEKRRPHALVILILVLCPGFFLTEAFKLLVRFPRVGEWAKSSPALYAFVFFSIQLLLISLITVIVSVRYRSSLWCPCHLRSSRSIAIGWLIGIPLMGWFGWYANANFAVMQRLSELSPGGSRKVVRDVFAMQWASMPYGSGTAGIVTGSIQTFAAPVMEEMLITGLLFNAFYKRLGALIATFATPLVFTALHIPNFGISTGLLALFAANLTYVLARLASGSLSVSISLHLFANFLVMLPKWAWASLYYQCESG